MLDDEFFGLKPMLLRDGALPLKSDGWAAELKFDGFRALALSDRGRVRIRTRNGADATRWWPELCSPLASIAGTHVFDGEVCVLDDIGRSDFDRMMTRSRMRGHRPGCDPVVFCIFDVIVAGGKSVMPEPLIERKALMLELLSSRPASILPVTMVYEKIDELFSMAVQLRLEGIVCKRLQSPYVPGARSSDWLKVKRAGAIPPGRFSRTARKGTSSPVGSGRD